MRSNPSRWPLILMSISMLIAVSGCSMDNIENQARSSLSSFVTGIVSSAISGAINGNN